MHNVYSIKYINKMPLFLKNGGNILFWKKGKNF